MKLVPKEADWKIPRDSNLWDESLPCRFCGKVGNRNERIDTEDNRIESFCFICWWIMVLT